MHHHPKADTGGVVKSLVDWTGMVSRDRLAWLTQGGEDIIWTIQIAMMVASENVKIS
jgi:hypothetical protein